MKHKLPNSIIVKNNDLGNGAVSRVIHVRGRYPKNGCACARRRSSIIYAMKGSGKVSSAGQTTDLKPGGAAIIKSGDCFYLKGQFSLYFIPVQ